MHYVFFYLFITYIRAKIFPPPMVPGSPLDSADCNMNDPNCATMC